jgi:4-amino-4-deoxy-L-arabinose transferase-like glycosyltransferase
MDGKEGRAFLAAGLLALSAISIGWTLSAKSLDDHECFVSVTAREMLENGNWILPTLNGQPRLQKTPMSYWLVAGLAKITGRVDEFTARLPSAVFAVLSVCVIIYFVGQWLSFRTALVCAGVWATSFGYIRYSHNARPEMALTFFVTLCFLSFYSAITAQNRKRQIAYMIVFWVSFGLGNLAKGPAPIPLVIIPLFFYVAIFRQWKQVPKLLPVVGVLILLAIMLPWPIAVAYKVNWDIVIWRREFVDRFFGEYAKGNYPVYYYLLIMFKYAAPWAGFLPMAIAAPFYRVWDKKQPIMQFLWILFIVELAFLTVSGGKRQHYILPVMPAMAILTGILLEDLAFVRNAYTDRFAENTLKIHAVAIIVAAIAAPVIILTAGPRWEICAANPGLVVATAILSAAAVVITIGVVILFAKGKAAAGCSTIFVAIIVWATICYLSVAPMIDINRYIRDFSLKAARIVPQSETMVSFERPSARVVHYFGRTIPGIIDTPELNQVYEDGNWVIAVGVAAEKLAKDGRFRAVFSSTKADYYKGYMKGALFHKSVPIIGENKQGTQDSAI